MTLPAPLHFSLVLLLGAAPELGQIPFLLPSPSLSLWRAGSVPVHEESGHIRLPKALVTQSSGINHSPSCDSIFKSPEEASSKPNSLSVVTYSWPLITFQKRFWVHAHC